MNDLVHIYLFKIPQADGASLKSIHIIKGIARIARIICDNIVLRFLKMMHVKSVSRIGSAHNKGEPQI